MKILLFHLSDIHLSEERQIELLHTDKIMQTLNSMENTADEYIIVISGDVASRGYKNHYNVAKKCIKQFLDRLVEKTGKTASLVIVPGNHDINFDEFSIDLDKVKEGYSANRIEEHVLDYISHMNGFYNFASNYKCFDEKEKSVVSKKCFKYDGLSIGITLVNSAPLSLLGGNADDMGYHFLSDDDLQQIENMTECDFNILVMHHSIEWFVSSVKSKLRDIISRRYNLLLTGHEHEAVGVEKRTNSIFRTSGIQGNALLGYAEDGNGFCLIMIDTDAKKTIGHSYIWKKDFYFPQSILESSFQVNLSGKINSNPNFTEKLMKDNRGRNYDDYYVFPGVEFRAVGENEDMSWEGENEEVLDELIDNYRKINICGGHKYGKTVLASRLYRRLLSKGKYPVLFNADDIQKKKIDRTTRLGIEEQYGSGDEQFERFTQIVLKDRIVLLDDASRIEPKTMTALMNHFGEYFGCIILLSEETIDLDIKRQVLDVVEEKNIYLSIKPFLYRTRKLLITRILETRGIEFSEAEHRAREINDQINNLVKYFDLSPEFIINFVDLYEKQSDHSIRFTTGMNVFNIVYDNSLKSRIINASVNMIEPKLVINVLRELAYYMHFSKLSFIKLAEFVNVVDSYNIEYRQSVNPRVALNVAIDSKILKENENRIYFRDRTLVAYFVAQALQHKYNAGDDIQDKTEYLLKHLCFGINSDIVLFLSLISNNPRILNLIINGAKNHFIGREELSLDRNNVPFLTEMNIPVKNSLPDKKEKEQRENIINEHEREVHVSELIELVDEYDYTEEDLEEVKNQVLVSFKYLEILSKALPAFCQEMKVEQQDVLVELIYRCPNQFLFMLLEDISRNHKQFCETLYQEVSELRREKNQSAISIESIERAVMQVSATLVLALYQLVAITSASPQSIEAINAFKYDTNANYRLQNLMMCARVDGLNSFSKKAKKFDKRATHNLEKSIIKYTVRDYFLRNNVELHGEAESLMAHFFNEKNRDVIKDRIIRNKYIADHSKNTELNVENEKR